MFVMAHAQGADGIKNAVRAGIRSIDHGIYLDDEGIELMLRHGTWFVPTLVEVDAVVIDRMPARTAFLMPSAPWPWAMTNVPAAVASSTSTQAGRVVARVVARREDAAPSATL